MSNNLIAATYPSMRKDDLIVITGAGGFIGGSLSSYYHNQGFTNIRAIDKKLVANWYQVIDGVENLTLDLSEKENARLKVLWKYITWLGGYGWMGLGDIEWSSAASDQYLYVKPLYRAGVKGISFIIRMCALILQDKKSP
jgi:hypothetical protein